MDADELRAAVTKIVHLIKESELRVVIDRFRLARADQRQAAAAHLSHAGSVCMKRIDHFSPLEHKILKCLHLDTLGSPDYWMQLIEPNQTNPKAHHAEIVRLASRVMFASSQLPALVALLAQVKPSASQGQASAPSLLSGMLLQSPEPNEGALFVRLTDAGERASDPDRIARAVDGIDMLYSACASLTRRPAMDLRFDGLLARPSRDRDLRFTGDQNSIDAVYNVIDSIPPAIAAFDPEQDIDLDTVVSSLPIFQDLNAHASQGTFSNKDLQDINETMHQGALLTLESGVILIDEDMVMQGMKPSFNAQPQQPPPQRRASSPSYSGNGSAAEEDEHYQRYLRERQAMLDSTDSRNSKPSTQSDNIPTLTKNEDYTRQDAVDELLRSLDQKAAGQG